MTLTTLTSNGWNGKQLEDKTAEIVGDFISIAL